MARVQSRPVPECEVLRRTPCQALVWVLHVRASSGAAFAQARLLSPGSWSVVYLLWPALMNSCAAWRGPEAALAISNVRHFEVQSLAAKARICALGAEAGAALLYLTSAARPSRWARSAHRGERSTPVQSAARRVTVDVELDYVESKSQETCSLSGHRLQCSTGENERAKFNLALHERTIAAALESSIQGL